MKKVESLKWISHLSGSLLCLLYFSLIRNKSERGEKKKKNQWKKQVAIEKEKESKKFHDLSQYMKNHYNEINANARFDNRNKSTSVIKCVRILI